MRVVSVIPGPTFGGPQNRNLRLVPVLRRQGIDTIVVLPDEPGNAAGRLGEAGIEVVQTRLSRPRETTDLRVHARFAAALPRQVASLSRLMKLHHADVVLINGIELPHAAIAARQAGCAVVWQILSSRMPRVGRLVLMPIVLGVADVVMSCGREVAGMHPGVSRLGDRLVPFYPVVDTAEFAPADPDRRQRARAELKIPDGPLLVGTVANLNPQKGLDHFVRSAALVTGRQECVCFRILGGANPSHQLYGRRVLEAATAAGLTAGGRLAIVDPGRRVAELIGAMDVFVMSSVPRSEAVSTTVLEAMSAGLPVVAAEVCGVREAVVDGYNGFVVPPLRPDMLAEKVDVLLGDSRLRAVMGARSRELALARFGIDRTADAHRRAYERAIEYRDERR